MAKLKCERHSRRVVVLTFGEVVHRNGDGSMCDTEIVTIGAFYDTPQYFAALNYRPNFTNVKYWFDPPLSSKELEC